MTETIFFFCYIYDFIIHAFFSSEILNLHNDDFIKCDMLKYCKILET